VPLLYNSFPLLLIALSSLSYYFQHLDRLFSPGYLPNTEDILNCRSPTTSTEIVFKSRDAEILLVGTGGQHSMWRRLMPLFQDVTSIVFVVDLDRYDQVDDYNEVHAIFLKFC
jgi:hypothetical protein